MSQNVVPLTPEMIESFRERKILLEGAEDIELEPVAGNRVLGELTQEEKALFVEVQYLHVQIEEWMKEISARQAESVASATRKADSTEEFYEMLSEEGLFESDEEAEDFFSEASRLSYLHGMLWWNVRTRLQTFGSSIAIRAGFKICHTGLKYKVKED